MYCTCNLKTEEILKLLDLGKSCVTSDGNLHSYCAHWLCLYSSLCWYL